MNEAAEGVGGDDAKEPEYQEDDEEGPEHGAPPAKKAKAERLKQPGEVEVRSITLVTNWEEAPVKLTLKSRLAKEL